MRSENKFIRGISTNSKKINSKGTPKRIPIAQIEINDVEVKHYSVSPRKNEDSISKEMLLPPKENNKKKTLVLDLDETLVRSTLIEQEEIDYSFKVIFI
ncbi:MAG: hypothetical protein MJ252_16425 [archaeon]|nr:hypothetical protein [archaeon]